MVELTWEGKYDADGRRTAPLRLRLPFQTVETVNESAQQRQMAQAGGRAALFACQYRSWDGKRGGRRCGREVCVRSTVRI